MKFVFMAQGKPPFAKLFGENIFDLEWFYLGQDYEVEDPRYKRKLTISLYQAEIQGDYYTFGAALLDDHQQDYLFYRIKQ